jgi:hypothetical protein
MPGKAFKQQMQADQTLKLLGILKRRFEDHSNRHSGIEWSKVQAKLEEHPEKLQVLNQMEVSGGEPDMVGIDKRTGEYIFIDCSKESPKGRRSLCYDNAALEARKEFKPSDSVLNMAKTMGSELLSEDEYRELQKLDIFDTKTSSWVKTPESIRVLGGALFCDRRYDNVFVYHNGADSYYSARGFRTSIRI